MNRKTLLFLTFVSLYSISLVHNLPKQFVFYSSNAYAGQTQNFIILKKGDTLYSISKKYNISIEKLKRINHLKSFDNLSIGTKIYYSNLEAYKIKQGDTLYSIAKRYKVSISELANLNAVKPPYSLKLGSTINIPISKKHIVKKGDTIYSISRLYNISIASILRINSGLDSASISVGDVLSIPPSARQVDKTIAITKPPTTNVINAKQNKTAIEQVQTKTFKDLRVTNLKIIKPKKPSNKQNRKYKKNELNSVPKRGGYFIKPVKGRIITKFGRKKSGVRNDGINIMAAIGTIVIASENGVVAYIGSNLRNYGKIILIKHRGGYVSVYAHLSSFSVKNGQVVKRRQAIGKVGSSGNVQSGQLHFQLRKKRQILNPEKYLRQ